MTDQEKMHKVVETVRYFSRNMVRELGFLRSEVPYSLRHALIEIEAQDGITSNELSERLILEKSTVSRLVGALEDQRLVKVQASSHDRRKKELHLTDKGKKILEQVHGEANQQVLGALELLSQEEREVVQKGISLYSKALRQSRLGLAFSIREIQEQDSYAVAQVIKTVMPEFGASGPGFAIHDREVNEMFNAYRRKGAAYFVVTRGDKVLGGAGIAPLEGGDGDSCELRKMYFLPELRGLGFGQKLMEQCLSSAKKIGYRFCYLETLKSMKQANLLYIKNGFKPLSKPLGNTGHFSCDAFYIKELN